MASVSHRLLRHPRNLKALSLLNNLNESYIKNFWFTSFRFSFCVCSSTFLSANALESKGGFHFQLLEGGVLSSNTLVE